MPSTSHRLKVDVTTISGLGFACISIAVDNPRSMSEPPPPFQPSPIEPLRVEALQYLTPTAAPPRPGIVVAVGVISIVLGCISVLYSASAIFMSVMYPSMRRIAATASMNVHINDTLATRAPPVMMGPQARAMAISGFSKKAPLSSPRQQMLDQLLSQAGDQMFPFAESAVTEDKVAASVNASGETSDPAGNAIQYFVIANGRIEVGDSQASFSPTHGASVFVYHADAGTNNSATAQTTTMPALPPFLAGGPVSMTPFVLYGAGGAANLLLALYLVVIGILVLARNRRGRGLHLIYAVLKIPVEIFAGIAYLMMMSQMLGGLGGIAATSMSVYAGVLTLLGCAYPVALLIVMNLSSIKAYFNLMTK